MGATISTIILVVLLLVIVVRNFRKDKSDGRDYLGGGRVGGGSGKQPVNRK